MKKELRLEHKITFPWLIAFALPTIFSSIFSSLYTTVDGIFVARWVNTDALSAINIVMPLIYLSSALGMMFGTGGNALVAKKIGEKKEVAARQSDLAFEVGDYLKKHPNAAVVNLGCGLDSTGRNCDNGSCKIYNLDFPDVIKMRNELLPAGEREENIACNLNDTQWFNKIDASKGAVFFASGVFYYFLNEEVKTLVKNMANAFPNSVLVFDGANRTAVKMNAKTWLKTAKIKDVGAYFAVSNAKAELSPWDENIEVSSRGYMLGYQDLKDASVNGFFRFLAKLGDNALKMQIVKISFKGK